MPRCNVCGVNVHVEVPIFLLLFTFMFESAVTTNFIIYRTCHLILGFNESECALLGTNYTDNSTAELERNVQPSATIILMWRSLAGSLIPPFLCFFLGPWSDKNGRRPIILYCFGAFIVSYLIMTIISAIPIASPWYILLYFIPVSVTGGFPAILAAMLSYITDVTTEDNRGLRMGVFESVYTVGVLLGTLSSSYMFNAFGYQILYSVCTICVFLAWLFTYLFIPESLSTVKAGNKIGEVFQPALLKETLQTVTKKRNYNDRALLLIVISILVVFVATNVADVSMVFLYLREEFQWSLKLFTFYISLNNITSILGSLFGTYVFNKLLGIPDIMVVIVGLLSSALGSVFLGCATKDWHIFAAVCVKFFGAAVSPMVRSLLSKLVAAEESGKIFSIITALESIGALIGSPIYTFLYNKTLLTHPSAFNFLTAGIFVLEMTMAIMVFIMQKHQDRKL